MRTQHGDITPFILPEVSDAVQPKRGLADHFQEGNSESHDERVKPVYNPLHSFDSKDIIIIMPATNKINYAADGQIVSNPGILGGRPVFAGTRVPAATLFEYLADGLTLDYFLESFPTVERAQAVAVLRHQGQRLEEGG